MKLVERLFGKRDLLPEEVQAPHAPGDLILHADDIPVRYEEVPNSLDLGWRFSEEKEQIQMVKVAQEDRATHLYVIGASGSGKTKFLEFLIQQDIQQGNGFAVIDPHGDLVEDIKGFLACYADYYGEEVFDRVVVVDPTDPNYTVGFNPLEKLPGVSVAEQAQELISAFRKIWADSWGSRMEDLLRNSLIALGEAGLTLVELPHFLTSQGFRRRVLQQVSHPVARDYFERFDALIDRARITWIEPVTNKINALLADERVAQLFASPKSTFQLREVMDSGKVLLVKLDKGRLRDSADLLGSLILAKIKMAAFSRSDVPARKRKPFHLYIDEFQNFATDSFSVMLSEARKYGLSLTMAHQTLAQVSSELRNLVLGNTGIQVYFRVGHQDAQVLANEAFVFSSHDVKSASRSGVHFRSAGEQRQLLAQDIQDLPPRVCYVKHKIEGGLVAIRTVDIEPPWQALNMSEADFQAFLASLPLGRKYLLEKGVAPRGSSPGASQPQPAVPGPTNEVAPTAAPARKAEASSLPPQPGAARVQTEAGAPAAQEQAVVPQAEAGVQAPLHKELITYLEHVAQHPFLAALQRDEALKLSRYKGALIRHRLIESGLLRAHKVGTGTRSGQLVVLELTNAALDLLASMKIKVTRPRGRGGFLHKYYAQRLKEFAEATWKDSVVQIEDGSLGKHADVTVRLPTEPGDQTQKAIAFEVFMGGEAKEIVGIAKGIEVFDRVIVCAESPAAVESLKAKAVKVLGVAILEKVSFSPVSQYLGPMSDRSQPKRIAPSQKTAGKRANHDGQQLPIPTLEQKRTLARSSSAQNRAKLELEIKRREGSTTSLRNRTQRSSLLAQIESAYAHLHDLDWLQESRLAELPAVKERLSPRSPMPQAQALRALLVEAANQTIRQREQIPNSSSVCTYLRRHLEGKSVTEIAKELKVTREWCSRSYRAEAIRMAAMQFARLVSTEEQKTKV